MFLSCSLGLYRDPPTKLKFLALAAWPFFLTFRSNFGDQFVYQRLVPKGLETGPSKQPNITTLTIETHSGSKSQKNSVPKSPKPLNLTTILLFSHFFRRTRAPKKEPKWSPRVFKILKMKKWGYSKNMQNTTLLKVGYCPRSRLKNELAFRG